MISDYLGKTCELQKVAMVVIMLLVSASGAQSQQKRERFVAVTFDDLPATVGDDRVMKSVNEKLLATLKANQIPAIGFVNEGKLAGSAIRIALLKRWLEDGHDLGNHSFSHIAIDRAPFAEYAADVIRGETVIRQLLREKGKALKYYRHTQLRTGPTEEYRKQLSEFLANRGYTVAPVTIDNNENIYAIAYARAKQSRDFKLQQRIVDDFLRYMTSVVEHFEKLSRDFLGREVKQILLLHANVLNADHFDKLVRILRARGYTFITLDDALKDEAYRLADAQSKRGLSWIHRWMLAKGLPMREEPLQPDWINQLAR